MLLGVVDNATDRQLAELRAREVTGVFSVENDLDVAGQGQEGMSKRVRESRSESARVDACDRVCVSAYSRGVFVTNLRPGSWLARARRRAPPVRRIAA